MARKMELGSSNIFQDIEEVSEEDNEKEERSENKEVG